MPIDFSTSKQFFQKPPISSDQQIDLLRERGLNIPDVSLAKKFIEQVSYSKLGGYFYILENSPEAGRRSHRFIENTAFQDIQALYMLNREISNILLSVLFDIELAFRSRLSDIVCLKTNNSFWHHEESVFHVDTFKVKTQESKCFYETMHQGFQTLILKNQKISFIEHHLNEYQRTYKLPFWLLKELLSFDKIIKIYLNLETSYQKIISKGFPGSIDVFKNYLHLSSYVRNLCAHNGRHVGFEYIHKPAFKTEVKRLIRNPFIKKGKSELPSELKTAIIIIHLMSRFFSIETDFVNKLRLCLVGFDKNQQYDFLNFDDAWFEEVQNTNYSASYKQSLEH